MAKYLSKNELEQFEFHDACFREILIKGKTMVWKLEYVNVTTKNTQNNLDFDMEAGLLYLTFKNFNISRFEFYGPVAVERSENLVEWKTDLVVPQSEYIAWVLKAVSENGELKYGGISETSKTHPCHSFDISIDSTVFGIDLEYSDVFAEWNTYKSKAWYVK